MAEPSGLRSRTPLAEKEKSQPDSKKAATGAASELEAVRAQFADAREQIGLRTQPITTLRLAFLWAVDSLIWLSTAALKSPITWVGVVPLIVLWAATKYSFAPHLFDPPICGEKEPGILWWFELAVKESSWWMVLGILSSIGFGTGLHSGVMFLFPHVLQVVAAAEACNTTSGLVGWFHHPCKLDCLTTTGPKDGSAVTVVRIWLLVTVQCMLWGWGTAIGELPPYLVSKAARLAGSKDSEYEAELEASRKSKDLFSRMKIWTIDFTEKHGFFGVFLLASWPNAAFDMCGMCCGYVLMPFWTFFIATSCGKGLVKVNLQALFFIGLFGSAAFEIMLSGVDSLNGTLKSVIGKDLDLRSLAVKGRTKIVRQFEGQSRFMPEKLFEGRKALDLAALKEVYKQFDNVDVVADRVLKEWDASGDGKISIEELRQAASKVDNKVSLGALDPGAPANIFKLLFEAFVCGLVLFFLFSVINQVAKQKQQDLDEAKLERLKKDKEKAK
jgi:hypothetical protein